MDKITVGSNHLNKQVYRFIEGNKSIVKARINTHNSKTRNMKMVQKDFKITECGDGNQEISFF